MSAAFRYWTGCLVTVEFLEASYRVCSPYELLPSGRAVLIALYSKFGISYVRVFCHFVHANKSEIPIWRPKSSYKLKKRDILVLWRIFEGIIYIMS